MRMALLDENVPDPRPAELTPSQAMAALGNVLAEAAGHLATAIYSHKQSVEGLREDLAEFRMSQQQN